MLKRILSVILIVLCLFINTNINVYADGELSDEELNKIVEALLKVRPDQIIWSEERRIAQAKVLPLIVTALRADGYTDEAIAGVVTNMMFESRLDPYIGQKSAKYFLLTDKSVIVFLKGLFISSSSL